MNLQSNETSLLSCVPIELVRFITTLYFVPVAVTKLQFISERVRSSHSEGSGGTGLTLMATSVGGVYVVETPYCSVLNDSIE